MQELSDSCNQFLPLEHQKDSKSMLKHLGERNTKIDKLSKPPTQPVKKKVSKLNDKENVCLEKLTKREAELNLKTFMTNF